MDKFELVSKFSPAGDQPKAISALTQGVLQGVKRQTLLGVTGSGKTFTIANVIANLNRPTLILSPNKVLAAQLYAEFKQFFPHNAVEYFISYYDYYQPEAYIPQTDTYIEKDSAVNEHIDKLRLKATTSLVTRKDVIVVASVSCIYNIGSPDSFREMRIYVKKGAEMTRSQLSGHLIKIQYQRDELEFTSGRFRMRGPFTDIMTPYSQNAIRVERNGKTISHIYEIHPITGDVVAELDEAWILETETGEPAAYANFRFLSGEGELMRIAVLPEYRGRGYSRKLMERLEESARAAGAQELTLEVRESNEAALHLYKSCGFRVEAVRKDYYRNPKENALILWKRGFLGIPT